MSAAALEELARREHLYPAVILHGGTAETRKALALQLARVLLCEVDQAKRPCGTCRHCSRVDWPGTDTSSFHPDFRVLERDLKTSTSVEATKTFLLLAQMAPFEARGQVFVLASAESLTGEAANALLKTLEEPPARTPRHFLLLCPSQFDLLPTVRSRSLPVYLGPGERPAEEKVEQLTGSFVSSMQAFAESGSVLDLLTAADALAAAGQWQDPRDTYAWILAAAAVKQSTSDLASMIDRARLLALAEDLLEGWRLRLRGIRPQRILEGMVVRHLLPSGAGRRSSLVAGGKAR